MHKPIFLSLILFTSIIISITTSCSKDNSCFDEDLYQKHKNDICTMDCPGVIGCDGKSYCNECIAQTQGIRVN